MPVWWKRPSKVYGQPSPANAQPDNGILGQPKPDIAPTTQIAQGDQNQAPRDNDPLVPPKPHRLHSQRAAAMEAMGLPDLAPPSPNPIHVPALAILVDETQADIARDIAAIAQEVAAIPQPKPPKPPKAPKPPQTLASRLDAIQEDMEVRKAQITADLETERYAADMNRQAEINGALAPQAAQHIPPEKADLEQILEMMSRGYLQIECARYMHVAPIKLLEYMRGTPERLARTQEAKRLGAQACDAKAMEMLRTAPKDDGGKARNIAAFLQWRARMLSPDYVDTSKVKVEGGLAITHMEPERAPITDLIGEALKPFTPAPRLIDVDDSPDLTNPVCP
jgi:hypothetical protein